MKKDKLKTFSIGAGIAFFLIIALLTYFSDTIDYMLLPKVKTAQVISGTLSGEKEENPNIRRYVVPVASVSGVGNSGEVYSVRHTEKGRAYVEAVPVEIATMDEVSCEVISGGLYNGMHIVFSTSKPIFHGDRVYVEGE